MRIPLDSEKWQQTTIEKSSPSATSVLKSWQHTPPSMDDFTKFVEAMGCSDCIYDSFYFSLPYLLDQVEASLESCQDKMIWDLRLPTAAEQANQSEECRVIFESCLSRIRKLLIARLEAMPSRGTRRFHLAGLAACYGDTELGQEIDKIDLDFSNEWTKGGKRGQEPKTKLTRWKPSPNCPNELRRSHLVWENRKRLQEP